MRLRMETSNVKTQSIMKFIENIIRICRLSVSHMQESSKSNHGLLHRLPEDARAAIPDQSPLAEVTVETPHFLLVIVKNPRSRRFCSREGKASGSKATNKNL